MLYRALLLVFFLSGALGLGYQILWSKYLLDFIGVSAYSYATVLASFMAGLALGSALLGRLADRVRSPLRLYALLELGVGAYALAYLPLMRGVASLYAGWIEFGPDRAGGGVGLGAKVAASGLLLLPPTVLLGGTFPAMVRHATESLGAVGRRVSQLYAVNALGAVAGTLAMAFLLMPGLGMRASLLGLGVSNGVLGIAALLLARRSRRADDAVPAGPRAVAPSLSRTAVRLALAFVLVEGLLSFTYEIAWTRYFGLVLGSSTYSFAVMLAAFITGISLGSAILARIESRIPRPLAFFGGTQVAVGVLVALPVPLYAWVPWLFTRYGNLFAGEPGEFLPFEGGKMALCYLFMLAPTVLIGMAIPLVVMGLARSVRKLGGEAGRVYAWNTWGGVAGSLLAGLLLLPALGTERLLRGAALGNALLGLAAVAAFAPRGRARGRACAAAAALAALVLAFQWIGPWDASFFSLVRFRRTAPLSFARTRRMLSRHEVLLFEDDPAANLLVTRNRHPGGDTFSLYVNGKSDASSVQDLPTQYLLAHVPLLLHPGASDVLIVGLASGITAGAALRHDVERVDVVELIRAMPRATRIFDPFNDKALDDPRLRLIFDDARSYISYTSQRYDVIISEPSNPWMAGTGSLFSRDFYERAGRALRPGGLYMQWLQTYEMSDATIAAVVRGFREAFPWVYGFQGNNVDLLLLGSLRPLEPDWDRVAARFEERGVREQLRRIGVEDLGSLLFLQRFSPASVDLIASLAERVNTDDNHFLEYRAPRDLFRGIQPDLPARLDERPWAGGGLLWSRWKASPGANVRPGRMLAALEDPRIRIEGLFASLRLALFNLAGPSGRAAGPPRGLAGRGPKSDEEFTRLMDRLVREGPLEDLSACAAAYAPSMGLQAALSSREAEGWIATVSRWRRAASEPRRREIVSRMRVDLLIATGRTGEAASALLEEIAGDAPPDPEWALLRACRLGDDTFLDQALAALAGARPSETVRRMRALRGGQRGGGGL